MIEVSTVESHLRVWGDVQLFNGRGSYSPAGVERDHTKVSGKEAESVAIYVESTAGFKKAHASLSWVYVALAEESELFDFDKDLLATFRRNLRARIKAGPWERPDVSEVLCSYDVAGQIANEVSARVDLEASGIPSLR